MPVALCVCWPQPPDSRVRPGGPETRAAIVRPPAFNLEALVPTRRTFELIVIVGVLLFPARATVRLWAKRQLGSQPEGSVLHGIGEVVVTVL